MPKMQIFLKSLWGRAKAKALGLVSEEFGRDLAVRTLLFVAVVAAAVLWIYAIFNFGPADFLVPLKYNSFLGVTSLGAWYQLYAVPLILIFLIAINTVLAHSAYKKDKMVGYVLLGTNIFLVIVASSVVINLSIMIQR